MTTSSTIQITGLTEAQVLCLTVKLESLGYVYDTDFTTLYGAAMTITGLRVINRFAAIDLLPICL